MPKPTRKPARKPSRKAKPPAKAKSAPKAALKANASKPISVPEIYKALEKILTLYSPPLKLWVSGTNARPTTHLAVPVPVSIPGIYGGKPINLEIASLVPAKESVAIHYLPLYIKPALKSRISPALLKCLKGLTCFHIKGTEPPVLEDVRKAIDVGAQFYRERGWL
jgi:hypothetical protein